MEKSKTVARDSCARRKYRSLIRQIGPYGKAELGTFILLAQHLLSKSLMLLVTLAACNFTWINYPKHFLLCMRDKEAPSLSGFVLGSAPRLDECKSKRKPLSVSACFPWKRGGLRQLAIFKIIFGGLKNVSLFWEYLII